MIGAILVMLAQTLVPGTAMTWTDGVHTWAGPPFCAEAGFLISPESPARNAGAITEINCPNPGSALNQSRLPDGGYCSEWYESAPDIGACEYVASGPALVCEVGKNTLIGCYYADQTFTALVLTRDDGPTLNFDWDTGSPGPNMPADMFTAKWQGDFDFAAGDYLFDVIVDDGVQLWIDDNLVISEWFDQPDTEYTAKVTFATAGTHRIKMEYYENLGGAVAKLNWQHELSNPPLAPSSLNLQ